MGGGLMANDSILQRFFSRQSFHRLVQNRKDDVFSEVARRYVPSSKGKTYAEIFSTVYDYISKSYRTEYYYKNKILNKMILSHKTSKNSVALQELPIGTSKADFVIINRKGRVYEIKTELDNLDRLKSQLDNYYKAFSIVNVVTYENNIEKICDKVSDSVGIICLTHRGAFKEIRRAVETRDLLNSGVMFDILRKNEYEEILLKEYGKLPLCGDFSYYRNCKALFSAININTSQKYLVKALKNRSRKNNDDFNIFPESIRLLLYFDREDKKKWRDIKRFLVEHYGG